MNTFPHASGSLSIMMVMNLTRFIEPDSASMHRFDQVRGSPGYAAFLHRLHPSRWFEYDTTETQIEQYGHACGTFRRHLINTSFYPTYQLLDTALALPRQAHEHDPACQQQINAWTYRLRLTRNGLVVVKMEHPIETLSVIDMLQLGGNASSLLPSVNTPALPLRQHIAMEVVARFLEACGCRFVIPCSERGQCNTLDIAFRTTYDQQRIPLHNSHTLFYLNQVVDETGEISAQVLRERYSRVVVALVENDLPSQHATGTNYKTDYMQQVLGKDFANKQEELCVVTAQTTVIYSPIMQTTSIDNNVFFWRGIGRGIEHIVALKDELQLLERETTRLLEEVPGVMRNATDGHLSKADRQDITALAVGMSRLFQSLPRQRDMLVSSSIFRTSLPTSIFEHMMQLLGIGDIERHIDTNVEELSNFLSHFNSIQLQQDAENKSFILSLLTIAISILVVPSFFADGVEIGWIDAHTLIPVPAFRFALLALLLAVGGIWGIVLLRRRQR
jgi:hypothetical protein